jgi:4-hydroxy-tetrahydrodipicolinate synthase
VIGIKEASGNLEKVMKLIQKRPKDFLVISGDDMLALPIMACGGDGCISVVANAFPKELSELVRLAGSNSIDKARKIHYRLHELMHSIFVDGNPSGIKGLLTVMGICSEHVRLPLTSVNRSAMNKFETLLKN